MSLINLEDDYPETEGIYDVVIESTHNPSRDAKATWSVDDGFTLIDAVLDNEEYIAYWKAL